MLGNQSWKIPKDQAILSNISYCSPSCSSLMRLFIRMSHIDEIPHTPTIKTDGSMNNLRSLFWCKGQKELEAFHSSLTVANGGQGSWSHLVAAVAWDEAQLCCHTALPRSCRSGLESPHLLCLWDAGAAGGGGGRKALLVWLQGVGFNPDPLEQQTIKAANKNKRK